MVRFRRLYAKVDIPNFRFPSKCQLEKKVKLEFEFKFELKIEKLEKKMNFN